MEKERRRGVGEKEWYMEEGKEACEERNRKCERERERETDSGPQNQSCHTKPEWKSRPCSSMLGL